MKASWYKMLETYAPELFLDRLSPFENLLKGSFEEVMINGWNEVYREVDGEMKKLEAVFESPAHYQREVMQFLNRYNQRLSVDKPILDFDLENQLRIHVLNRHISRGEVLVCIRKSGFRHLNEEELLLRKFFTKAELAFLKSSVREKKTIFISGETSSGKTTLLNLLLSYIPKEERLIILEDTQEVRAPAGRNCVYLRTRESEFQVREVNMGDLLKASLRMRPDRIILGEIRREEVVEFLHAITTGHQGSLSTGHGSSAQDMLSRLEILLLEAGLPYAAARRYLGHGIDYILQLGGKYNRHLESITAVDYREGEMILHELDSMD